MLFHPSTSDEGWAPILILARLRINPHQTIRHKVFHHSHRSRPAPPQVQLQHAHGHVAHDLHRLKHGALVRIQLLGHAPDQTPMSNLDNIEAAAQRFQRPDGLLDIRIAHIHGRPNRAAATNVRLQIGQGDEATVLSARRPADIDNGHAEVEVEIVHAPAQQRRPDALAALAAFGRCSRRCLGAAAAAAVFVV